MARPDKAAAVAEIVDSFNDSTGAVLTEYRGLTVKQLQDLRRALGENANYAVVKNTLTKIAAKQAGVDGVDDLLNGPTAIAFINGDLVEAAKGLRDFAKANPALVVKGGYVDGAPMEAAEIAKLADLESREVLLGKLAGAMLASLSQAVYLLNAPLAQAARSSVPWRRRPSRTPRSSRAVPASRQPRSRTQHPRTPHRGAPAPEDTPAGRTRVRGDPPRTHPRPRRAPPRPPKAAPRTRA